MNEFDALDVAALNARTAYTTQVTAVSMLEQLIDTLKLALAAKDTTIVDLTARNATQAKAIVELAAEIERLKNPGTPPVVTPPPVIPPTRFDLVMGATVDPAAGLSREQTVATFIRDCGPLEVIRLFFSNAPTKAALLAAIAPHVGKRHMVISYKGDLDDATLLSIPSTVGKFWTILVKFHEPENDGGTHTAAWYKSTTNTHVTQVKRLRATGRTDLVAGFVLMGWLDNDPSLTTTSTAWFPDIVDGVVMLLDPYDLNGNVNLPLYVMNSLTLWRHWCVSKGVALDQVAWGIAEAGTQRTGAAGAGQVTGICEFARAERAWCLCWFQSDVNPKPKSWRLTDPLMQAAWKAQTAL